MVKGAGRGDASGLTRLLLEGRKDKDYSGLLSYLRGLPPSRLDAELRSMQARPPFFRTSSTQYDSRRDNGLDCLLIRDTFYLFL